MVICFDASTEAKRSLDALIETGQFRDTSEVISMALVNYEVLQRNVPGAGHIIPTSGSGLVGAEKKTTSNPSPSPASGPRIPEIFFLESYSLAGLKFAEVGVEQSAEGEILPPARWLFGQFNKFLPVKASCRALLNLMRETHGGVNLSEAIEKISMAAWEFGDFLYMLDERLGRQREESFAAAFPTSARNGAVSRIRFANQFVGDLRQPKQVEGSPREIKFNGLPSALKFITCSDGKSPELELTDAGAGFANLRNPVLDESQPAANKFSDAEIQFLLTHINRFVPEEKSAYFSIIDAIQQGANTPDDLDNFLCKRFNLRVAVKAVEEDEITQTFLTTQRTGAISRMSDLGLIAREKTGLRVNYVITPSAKHFRNQPTSE